MDRGAWRAADHGVAERRQTEATWHARRHRVGTDTKARLQLCAMPCHGEAERCVILVGPHTRHWTQF